MSSARSVDDGLWWAGTVTGGSQLPFLRPDLAKLAHKILLLSNLSFTTFISMLGATPHPFSKLFISHSSIILVSNQEPRMMVRQFLCALSLLDRDYVSQTVNVSYHKGTTG